MRLSLSFLLLLLIAGISSDSQILPDRTTHIDPLADTSVASGSFQALPSTGLVGEFGRYTDGSGNDHRWNAKSGGYIELFRTSGRVSVGIHGLMEVVMDPLNDIAFNPRAIFWEEGLFVATDAPWSEGSIQFGYTHRCKHDIDNLEVERARGEAHQRTLIYSGPFVRGLRRPSEVGTVFGRPLTLGGSIRGDLYLHKLDDRTFAERAFIGGRSIEDLIGSTAITGRIGIEPVTGLLDLHLAGGIQVSLYGDGDFIAGGLEQSVLWGEFGLELDRPGGSALGLYIRAESQADAGIGALPASADLLLIGLRARNATGTW